jgi:hypothetical protein
MRLYRKSDADLLATIIEERDQLEQARSAAVSEVASLRVRVEAASKQLEMAYARIYTLEETNQKFFESQNQTVKTLLAGTVESNAPIVFPEQREQVKITTPPRGMMATLKERAIKTALAAQAPKKSEVVH